MSETVYSTARTRLISGWGPWVKLGEWAGTKDMGLQIEAIEFRVA